MNLKNLVMNKSIAINDRAQNGYVFSGNWQFAEGNGVPLLPFHTNCVSTIL